MPPGPPSSRADATAFVLEAAPAGLSLRCARRRGYGPIRIDWRSAAIARRVAAGRGQPLSRALGLQHAPADWHIVDATAGLGRDGWVLASLGARVTLVERVPPLARLLADAMDRALQDGATGDVAARMTLIEGDAQRVLAPAEEAATVLCDAVYLDPMYPEDGKSALPAKEMQLLRELTGGDPDAAALLALARRRAGRVVVKRSRLAPPLASAVPDATVPATRVRFDLYLQPALMRRR